MASDVAESLVEEQRVSQELLMETEKRYQNQVRLLEQGKEVAEHSLSEVRTQLHRERAQWQEDLSAAQRQAKVREVCLMVFSFYFLNCMGYVTLSGRMVVVVPVLNESLCGTGKCTGPLEFHN